MTTWFPRYLSLFYFAKSTCYGLNTTIYISINLHNSCWIQLWRVFEILRFVDFSSSENWPSKFDISLLNDIYLYIESCVLVKFIDFPRYIVLLLKYAWIFNIIYEKSYTTYNMWAFVLCVIPIIPKILLKQVWGVLWILY